MLLLFSRPNTRSLASVYLNKLMAFPNLAPQKADTTVVEGDGGGYYTWTPAKTPVVVDTAVAAGKLVLQPRGFALPHYALTKKIGYVVQGSCTVGLVLPNDPEEKILIANKGDAIPVPLAAISWWYNAGDSDATLVFLGDSSGSYTPGQFDYLFLTGPISILPGFSTDFISNIYGLNYAQSQELAKSQPNPLIFKVAAYIDLPLEANQTKDKYIITLYANKEPGGDDSALIDEIGLRPSLVRLEPEATLGPNYSTGHKMIYVMKGKGRIQIVGLNGARVLDESVEEGQLIVVPRFFVAALAAGEKGVEFLSVSTSSRALSGELGGQRSAYKVLSSSVLQASLNVSAEFLNDFSSKF